MKGGAAQAIITPSQLPSGMHVADGGTIAFNRTSTAVAVLASHRRRSIRCRPTRSSARPTFDLWHYKDQVLQPTQRLNAARDRNKSYSAIYFTQPKKVVQLADDSIPTVNVSEDGQDWRRELARAVHDRADVGRRRHRRLRHRSRRRTRASSSRKRSTATRSSRPTRSSSCSTITANWYSYNTATGKMANLTGGLKGVHFDNETDDHPAEPPAWGIRRLDEGRHVGAALRSLRHLGARSERREAGRRRDGFGRSQEQHPVPPRRRWRRSWRSRWWRRSRRSAARRRRSRRARSERADHAARREHRDDGERLLSRPARRQEGAGEGRDVGSRIRPARSRPRTPTST